MLRSWEHGYIADIPYPIHYQLEHSPAWLGAICAFMGVAWDRPEKLVFGDLGCGRGFGALLHAAANPEWETVGVDFSPAQIAEAREVAAAAGLANAHFVELDLAAAGDAEIDAALPVFDVVTLHGFWNWVSDEVREGALRVLRRRLKPGGLVLVGANTLPGFAHGMGVQRLLRSITLNDREGGTSAERVVRARALIRRLHEAGARNLNAELPEIRHLLELDDREASYLVHEYLTEHWRPTFHADIAAAMGTAKLEFVGSARVLENVPDLVLTPEQRTLRAELPPGPGRELVFDLCVERGFRMDVFVRGTRRVDRAAALDAILFGMIVDPALETPGEPPRIVATAPQREIGLKGAPAEAIAAALRGGVRSLRELREAAGIRIGAPELATLLLASGNAIPAWRRSATAAGMDSARRFNIEAATRYGGGRTSTGALAVASPVLGAGVPSGAAEIELIALLARGAPRDPRLLAQMMLGGKGSAEAAQQVRAEIDKVLLNQTDSLTRLGVLPRR